MGPERRNAMKKYIAAWILMYVVALAAYAALGLGIIIAIASSTP